jgi:hypothetical protein
MFLSLVLSQFQLESSIFWDLCRVARKKSPDISEESRLHLRSRGVSQARNLLQEAEQTASFRQTLYILGYFLTLTAF